MKLEKRIVIGISKEERYILKGIVSTVEEALNINIEDSPEDFAEVISKIIGGYSVVHNTSMGDIGIEYDI